MRSNSNTAQRRSKRRGKILYSLIVLMLLAGLVPLLLTTVSILTSSRQALESAERLLQLDQTRSIAQQSRLYLQSMHQRISAIAETFQLGSDPAAVSARLDAVTPEALLDFVEEDRVHTIMVFDREGNFVSAGYSLDDAAISSSFSSTMRPVGTSSITMASPGARRTRSPLRTSRALSTPSLRASAACSCR